MHYGSLQQTANVPTPSIVASASSQPMISSPPLPQSSLQPTVIGSSHTFRTFVCPKTGMPFKTKSIAHKPKPKLVIGTSTKARAQQGPKRVPTRKFGSRELNFYFGLVL
ncbi:hypothetical protein RchiOBHm_Chr3g0477061 [Rosa chinensis]|uniref:Uncharacterized protein n=1 Tax=Rosa chinensis TaxID=74649 RepID=A0A2P6RCV0_ROSCH|nr:hypothetical protein RchiOBHm_Chr3g0477061 [Rosa chinensis]